MRCVLAAAAMMVASCGLDLVGVARSNIDAGPATTVDASADVGVDAPHGNAPTPTDAGTDAADARADADADADAVVPCPENPNRRHEGHCYFLITAPGSQETARTKCIQAGAHLVAINSASEQVAIESLGSGERWIGLYSATIPPLDNPANYAWLDGPQTPYRHWQPGLPNENGPCVLMDRGDDDQWVDRACNVPNAAICERE